MEGAHAVEGRAAVTFPAPHGTDSVVLRENDVVQFGRGGDCEVRFGYAPIADAGVPRAWLGVWSRAAQRLFVESIAGPGRRSIEITTPGRPSVLLAAGDGFAPSESEFRVIVHGEQRAWPLLIVVRRDDAATQSRDWEPPTRGFQVRLTEMQRRVLAAYMEPLQRGRLEPATHREVALALSYHPNSAREALYEVWARLFAAGVPMPDVSEKRIAVVEAARLHRLLDDGITDE